MNEHDISRRNFLKGAGVAAGAAAMAGLAGCASGGAASASAAASASEAEEASASAAASSAEAAAEPAQAAPASGLVDAIGDPDNRPGFIANPDLRDAEPIPPVDAPASWDGEADYVVVGTGGGGLAAATLLAQEGNSVIVLEKQGDVGGTTQEAHSFLNMAGNGRDQIALGFHEREYPETYDRDAFVRQVAEQYQFSADTELLGNIADNAGECVDWMQDNGANMLCTGELYEGPGYAKLMDPEYDYDGPATTSLRAMRPVCEHFHELAESLGADFHLGTPVTALVMEGDRVVGVQSNDEYYRGEKGVILCAGGFGMNPDMVKKFMPTAYKTIVHGGPLPHDTGEVQRMAFGCGAEMTGLDSWCTWEYEPDNDTGEWTYFWGVRQLTQLPWLRLDALGKRVHYFDPRMGEAMPAFIGFGDTCGIADLTARVGARGYMFFDSKFEQYIFPENDMPMALGRYGERCPMNFFEEMGDPDPIVDSVPIAAGLNWRDQFEEAIEDGRIKQADTLEELCQKLGLDPEVILPAIDKWNAACETKEDYDIYPYPPSWMNPVAEGPFYGAKTGGILGKCLTGLLVDPEMRVIGANHKPIPGLYANCMTAGGVCGASSYCGNLVNTSIVGGNGLSWTTGYLAAKTAMADA